MKEHRTARTASLGLGGAALLTLACTCGLLGDQGNFSNSREALATEFEQQMPALATELSQTEGAGAATAFSGESRGQGYWASSAVASSEYGNPSWAAIQAVGAPDTFDCGDITTAWASASSVTKDWIELTYETPLLVSEVNIIQTYHPNQVVRVELQDLGARFQVIYEAFPVEELSCPFTLHIPVARPEFAAQRVVVVIDQSILGLGWNEIDAVELVGDLGY
ncbi:MAG: hypothetical protein WD040_07155 [Anaerolineales bacterium]